MKKVLFIVLLSGIGFPLYAIKNSPIDMCAKIDGYLQSRYGLYLEVINDMLDVLERNVESIDAVVKNKGHFGDKDFYRRIRRFMQECNEVKKTVIDLNCQIALPTWKKNWLPETYFNNLISEMQALISDGEEYIINFECEYVPLDDDCCDCYNYLAKKGSKDQRRFKLPKDYNF